MAGDDALLALHIAFFAVFAAHLGLVVKDQLFDRDGLLRRMQ